MYVCMCMCSMYVLVICYANGIPLRIHFFQFLNDWVETSWIATTDVSFWPIFQHSDLFQFLKFVHRVYRNLVKNGENIFFRSFLHFYKYPKKLKAWNPCPCCKFKCPAGKPRFCSMSWQRNLLCTIIGLGQGYKSRTASWALATLLRSARFASGWRTGWAPVIVIPLPKFGLRTGPEMGL